MMVFVWGFGLNLFCSARVSNSSASRSLTKISTSAVWAAKSLLLSTDTFLTNPLSVLNLTTSIAPSYLKPPCFMSWTIFSTVISPDRLLEPFIVDCEKLIESGFQTVSPAFFNFVTRSTVPTWSTCRTSYCLSATRLSYHVFYSASVELPIYLFN